jgi:hypothetical protein
MMRESREVARVGAAFGRHASAWLVLTALLGLWLSQPLHLAVRATPAEATPTASAVVQLPSQDATHDASGCQLCRVAAQTRTSLRSAVHASPVVPSGLSSRLERVTSALPKFEPVRDAWPRAPPTARVLLFS